jgi:hypothetical protein
MNPILLFLETIYLQAPNAIQQLWNYLVDPSQASVEGTVILTPNFIPVITGFIILAIFLLFVRFLVLGRRRPNNEQHIGIIAFSIPKVGIFEAYVNRYDAPFRVSILRALKRNKKLAVVADELIRLRKEKKIFFYQIYYRDVRDLMTSVIRRRRIPPLLISNAPLDDPRYVFSQSEPKFSFASFGYDYVETCHCNVRSEKFEVETASDDFMDVWFINAEPQEEIYDDYEADGIKEKTVELSYQVFEQDLSLGMRKKVVNITLPDEGFARSAPNIVLASKQVDYIESLDEHIQSQEAELKERDKVINRLRQSLNLIKLLVAQKKLVGSDIPATLARPKEFLTWIAMAGLATLGATMIPDFVPQARSTPPEFLGVLALITIVGIYMFTRRSGRQHMEDILEEEGIVPETGAQQ